MAKVIYKAGDRFRVLIAQENYVVGEVYTVSSLQTGMVCGTNKAGQNMGKWIAEDKVKPSYETKEEILLSKESLVAQLEVTNAKLKYLDENSLVECDEKAFKVYQALTILDETKSKQERTRKLVDLIGAYV